MEEPKAVVFLFQVETEHLAYKSSLQSVLIWYDQVAPRVFFHNFLGVFCFHRIQRWNSSVQTIILFTFYISLSIYDNFSFQWNRLCFFYRNLLFNQVKNAWLLMKSRKTKTFFFDKMCDCSIKKKREKKTVATIR